MNAQTMIMFFQVLILLIQVVISVKLFSGASRTKSTYECDRLFMEIEKTLISDPRLWELYEGVTPDEKKAWRERSEDSKRLYILCEMNYFLFAFVHRESLAGRATKSYWGIYENWLRKLLRCSPIFREVHENEREFFEPKFAKRVDQLLRGSLNQS